MDEQDLNAAEAAAEMARHAQWPGFEVELTAAFERAERGAPNGVPIEDLRPSWEAAIQKAHDRDKERGGL